MLTLEDAALVELNHICWEADRDDRARLIIRLLDQSVLPVTVDDFTEAMLFDDEQRVVFLFLNLSEKPGNAFVFSVHTDVFFAKEIDLPRLIKEYNVEADIKEYVKAYCKEQLD